MWTKAVGTSCSGIGAPEQAFRQLGLNAKIMIVGDIDKYVSELRNLRRTKQL